MPKLTIAKGPDEDALRPGNDLSDLPLAQAAAPAPTAHHPRGMSGWPAILACPCYEGKGDSKDAAAGTAIHAKLAWWLEAYKRDGALPEVDWADLSLHETGAYLAAQWIVSAFALSRIPRDRLHVEHRCTLPNGVFGTADAMWVDETHTVHVVDFKAFYNPGRDYFPQLGGYGLAVAESLLKSAWSGTPEGDIVICMDVLYGDKANAPGDGCECSLHEARATCSKAMDAYNERDAGTAKPAQCNWCDLCAHHATCPAVTATIEALPEVNDKDNDDGAPDGAHDKTPSAQRIAPWASLAPERKAQLLVVAEFAAKWADTVKTKAKEDALAGVALEDAEHGIRYTLRESKGRSKPRVADLWPLLAQRGVTPQDYKSRLTISAADAEALLKGVGLTAKAAKELIATVSDVGKGSVSLVRA